MSEYMPRGEPPATPNQQEFVDSFPYGAIVGGSLLYLAVVTRLDIERFVA
jgi:hypothetical protein